MKYIKLFGKDIKEDISTIRGTINGDSDVVFVYHGRDTLYDYIDALYDKSRGLSAKYLYKFKVCYEKPNLTVSYSAKGGRRNVKIESMSSLINELDGKTPCKIVVENDEREQLAFIVQQLIFIEYPLNKVDILLRKEERDADKTKRFMEHVNELLSGCETALTRLIKLRYKVEIENDNNNPTKIERLKDIDDALGSCSEIKAQIEKSVDVELKFAVAASKKAGKSVIVNCFLGEQIAPTSTELATPNNCIYKRSADNLYHLKVGNGDVQDFETRDAIYDEINSHFRKAQNNAEDGFALPDMDISYVTEKNNFSSYTIYDTAGPDAAGAAHAEAAKRAMQKCDVAVFAIDYSKYLTTSEEDYLRQVKAMFTQQNKFHSLIFALNKIDVRYTDAESPKSFIMSVDFLKTRLAKIDEAYRDCIIFPTCSLEYFSAIEAESAGVAELNAEIPIGEMKGIKFAHKDVPALAWLHTHSENLEYYHDIKSISYDVFKRDSGMPALMSYVSYVAQSKARDEIVNSVTYKIDSQKKKIQSVLDFINNIEALINADDEKINEISGIVTEYTDSVNNILKPDFSQDELAELKEDSLLRLKSIDGDYEKFIEYQRKTIEPTCEKKSLADAMYESAVKTIWDKVKDVEEIDGNQIDQLFSADDFNDSANKIAKQKIEQAAVGIYKQLSKLSGEVKSIAEYRQVLLKRESVKCREKLAKEHIDIELPELPEFEFATEMTPPSEVIVKVASVDFKLYDRLSDLFEKKFFANIGTFFKKLLGIAADKDYKLKRMAGYKDFKDTCDKNLYESFKNAVYENDIHEALRKELDNSVVEGYMKPMIKELQDVFESMNDVYTYCVERFRSAVDERDKYKADIELHNLRKTNIEAIGSSISDFMSVWNVIMQDINGDEEAVS